MRAKKSIRFVLCVVMIIMLSIGVVGCTPKIDYRLVEIGGKHYLIFDKNNTFYKTFDDNLSQVKAPIVEFDSIKQFKETVTKGYLTEEQKKDVRRFEKDDKGRIKIFDFQNLFSPILPQGQRTDAFELWCWRRPLRVLWTARKSNQSVPKDVNPEGLFIGTLD